MGLKLSIIVPIYKVESYLPKCVDSLLNQDLSPDEYEIILVDDGSPDSCGKMCDNYAATYPNIIVLHRENGGLSAARNSGIEMAKGQYVQFVDSDDYLEPNVLKSLVTKMETDRLDALRFNYQNVNERYEVFEPNKLSKPFVDYRDEVCDGLTFLNERLGFGCYAWQFIIRRELLDGCVFKEGIYFEDTEWTPRLLLKANRVTSTDLMVYNYLIREGSITNGVDEKKRRKVLDDLLLSIDFLKQNMKDAADKRWFGGMIALLVLSVVSYVSINYYDDRKKVMDIFEKKKVSPLSFYHATGANPLKIRIYNICPSALYFILHLRSIRSAAK